MKCPYCSYPESKVVDSRPADEGASIRRRRECLACHKRFTTYETMETLPLMVVKKDGSARALTGTRSWGASSGPVKSGRCPTTPWRSW